MPKYVQDATISIASIMIRIPRALRLGGTYPISRHVALSINAISCDMHFFVCLAKLYQFPSEF
jgi:hypothetical protein